MGSVTRLATAAPRKVRQSHNRAAWPALPRLPVEFVSPSERRMLAEKAAETEALHGLERTPELAILLALMATMPAGTLSLAVDEIAKIVETGGPNARTAYTVLKIAAAKRSVLESVARMEADHG